MSRYFRQYQAGPILLTLTDDHHFSLRMGRRIIILKGPMERPPFSERNGRIRVLSLGGGWRVTVRKAYPIAWRVRRMRSDA